jgi:hypothetical protein
MTEGEWTAAKHPAQLLRFLTKRGSERKLRLFNVACCRRVWHLVGHPLLRRGVETEERFADGEGSAAERAEAARAAGAAFFLWAEVGDAALADYPGYEGHGTHADVFRTPEEQEQCERAVADLNVKIGRLPRGLSPRLARSSAAGAAYVCVISRPRETDTAREAWPWAEAARAFDRLGTKVADLRDVIEDAQESASQVRLLHCLFGNPFRPTTVRPEWLSFAGGTIPGLARAIYEERAFDRLPVLADALEDAGCTDAAILEHCRGPGEHARGCWVIDLLLGKS